jgi:hypothetical protein
METIGMMLFPNTKPVIHSNKPNILNKLMLLKVTQINLPINPFKNF